MAYLIILLALAMAIAPIMALKPSETQKRQMRLRDKAREKGLQVQVGELPQTRRQQVRREDTESGAAYRLQWRHPVAKRRQFSYSLDRRETEPGRAPQVVLELLQQTLEALPEAVVALEFTHQGVAVFWREVGDEDTVERIAEQLHALQQALQRVPTFN